MATLTPELLLPLLYRALREEIGLAVPTNDKRTLRVLLYEARKQAGDLQLNQLVLFAPNGDEIFITKKATEMEE